MAYLEKVNNFLDLYKSKHNSVVMDIMNFLIGDYLGSVQIMAEDLSD